MRKRTRGRGKERRGEVEEGGAVEGERGGDNEK